MKNKKITIVTHNGTFHTDDLFAVTVIIMTLRDAPYEIIRTRNQDIIDNADFVIDVGSVYDEAKNRFDHHQEGGAGERVNGIPYSSLGLVWKKFGEQLCGSRDAADVVDENLCWPVDAADNGEETYNPVHIKMRPYIFHNITEVFRPTWKEEDRSFDDAFMELIDIAKSILEREIKQAKDIKEGEDIVRSIYEKSKNKQIIIFDKSYPWRNVLNKYPEPLFIIKPDHYNGYWTIKAVKEDPNASFKNRKDLPLKWAGKRGKEFAGITGVSDAIFCHNKRFIAVAGSKEGALALAKLALEN